MIKPITRQTVTAFLIISLALTTACGSETAPPSQQSVRNPSQATQTNSQRTLPDGKYQLQQATYDDVSGQYRLFLLNTNRPVLERENIKMARLTPEEVEQGQKSYLFVENGEYSLHLDEDFRIEYIHGVAETRTNPETGQQERVIVRRESNFWTPFAGALAGQAIGNMLFTPQYYVPPAYQPGTNVLTGYGGYGRTYSQAVDRYQNRYQSPPPSVENRRAQVRTTGRLNRSTSSNTKSRSNGNSSRSTGSGIGTNTLDNNNRNDSNRVRKSRGSRFGSGMKRSRTRSRGRRRR